MAERFLYEFEFYGKLEVCLVPQGEPANSGACNRAVMNQNAPWYRKFCAKYENCRGRGRKRMRRPRTFINRLRIPAALQRIIDGRPSGVYCERLLVEIKLAIANERHARNPAIDDGFEFGEDGIWF